MELIEEAVRIGLDLLELLRFGFNAGNREVSNLFERGEDLDTGIDHVYRDDEERNSKNRAFDKYRDMRKTKGTIVIATVEGDNT